MQINPEYEDVTRDLLAFFAERIALPARQVLKTSLWIRDLALEKPLDSNYKLLHELRLFEILGFPVMVGLSRKSMIYKPSEFKS